jgi:hypothetical protein
LLVAAVYDRRLLVCLPPSLAAETPIESLPLEDSGS